LVVQIPKAKN